MTSTDRLQSRLALIPTDPTDPECLADIVVCAFGAFERYYVCWKTINDAYRQDGYDLPPDLEHFLFANAAARDFASLQVVFGRGDAFFAADANGKLESKETESVKKEKDFLSEDMEPRRALRRSRTVSFARSDSRNGMSESEMRDRRSSVLGGRPPSWSPLFLRSGAEGGVSDARGSHVRLGSDSLVSSQASSVRTSVSSRASSARTSVSSRPASDPDVQFDEATKGILGSERPPAPPPIPTGAQSTRRLRPLSLSFKGAFVPRIPEGQRLQNPSSHIQASPPVAEESRTLRATTEALSAPYSQPLTIRQRTPDQSPETRSISPPFQLPDQTDSPTSPKDPRLPIPSPPARLSLQITTAAQITPISPATPQPPPPKLSIQILSTAVETAPVVPPPSPHPKLDSTTPSPKPSNPPSTMSTATQTPPPPAALRIDTTYTCSSASAPSPSSSAPDADIDVETPQDGFYAAPPPPVFMGRMMEYYSKPGYQLGQSLFGGYGGSWGEMVVEVSGELTEWERANGRGY